MTPEELRQFDQAHPEIGVCRLRELEEERSWDEDDAEES